MSAPLSLSRITQDYFDELVQENVDVFDLSPEGALKETLQQLHLSGVTTDHLLVTYKSNTNNNDELDPERREREEFQTSLTYVRTWVTHKNSGDELAANDQSKHELVTTQLQHLHTIQAFLAKDFDAYLKLWEMDGFYLYLKLLELQPDETPHPSITFAVLETLALVVNHPKLPITALPLFQRQFSSNVMTVWMKLYLDHDAASVHAAQEDRQSIMLSLAYWSCKRCEANKQQWMEQRHKSTAFVDMLVKEVQQLYHSNDTPASASQSHNLLVPILRILTVLCRNDFDEFDAPPTASATSRVQQFTASGQLIPALHQHLQQQVQSLDGMPRKDDPTLLAILQACRALAIHNDVVITMKRDGLVETVLSLWKSQPRAKANPTNWTLLTACCGLFRNGCANDDVKSLLGHSILTSLMALLTQAVGMEGETAIVAPISFVDQGIGLIGALALRHTNNAQQLVQLDAPAIIVAAMQLYPQSSSLQRTCAYALRNVISRGVSASTNNHDSSLEALRSLCQPVLLEAARSHPDCQEAVYAALRDLGCHVQWNKVVVDEHGRTQVQQGTSMFAPGSNAGFRAVYD